MSRFPLLKRFQFVSRSHLIAKTCSPLESGRNNCRSKLKTVPLMLIRHWNIFVLFRWNWGSWLKCVWSHGFSTFVLRYFWDTWKILKRFQSLRNILDYIIVLTEKGWKILFLRYGMRVAPHCQKIHSYTGKRLYKRTFCLIHPPVEEKFSWKFRCNVISKRNVNIRKRIKLKGMWRLDDPLWGISQNDIFIKFRNNKSDIMRWRIFTGT